MTVKAKFLILGCLTFTAIACSSDNDNPQLDSEIKVEPTPTSTPTPLPADEYETFTFSSNGVSWMGKIFLPDEFETNKNLPAIYLIDFTEQHFQVATDEFEKVIRGVNLIKGLNAVVVTFAKHPNINLILPNDFQKYSDVYKDMASYVDEHYIGNASRTFIGRGSEAGQVLMTLFLEEKETSVFQNFIATDTPSMGLIISMIEKKNFPQEKDNKRLHYSFSSTGDYDANMNLISTINEQEYPWLEFKSVEYSNRTYESAYPTAFADGLKFIFEDY